MIALRASRLSAAALFALLPRVSAGAEPARSLTADFAGDGVTRRAEAEPGKKSLRLTIRSSDGKRLARADAPSPGGEVAVALRPGDLGSAGTLIEAEAAAAQTVCRSVWRYRAGTLSRLPIRDGGRDLPDCEPGGWTSRWEKSGDAPARYVRERARRVAQGDLHESRAFAFAGFSLDADPASARSEINGVVIPSWYDAQLYPKRVLELLFQRFGLAPLRKGPRLRFEIDRDAGVFAARLRAGADERRLPVTSSKPLESGEGVLLTAGDPAVTISVTLLRGDFPNEVTVRGAGEAFDGSYSSVVHWTPRRIEVYPDAERELVDAFPGAWANEKSERLDVSAVAGRAAIRIGAAEFDLSLDDAPDGSDVLLVPRDRGTASWAVTLRGPNAFARTPARCDDGSAPRECRLDGSAEVFRRIGGQVNVR